MSIQSSYSHRQYKTQAHSVSTSRKNQRLLKRVPSLLQLKKKNQSTRTSFQRKTVASRNSCPLSRVQIGLGSWSLKWVKKINQVQSTQSHQDLKSQAEAKMMKMIRSRKELTRARLSFNGLKRRKRFKIQLLSMLTWTCFFSLQCSSKSSLTQKKTSIQARTARKLSSLNT